VTFEWFVALRYLREGRMQTALILGAVAIGVAVLVFLSSLMMGVQDNLVAKTLGAQASIVVKPADLEARVVAQPRAGELFSARVEKPSQRQQSIVEWRPLQDDVGRMPGVVATSPYVSGPAFLVRGASTKAVAVRGIDPESFDRIIALSAKLTAGRWAIAGTDALLGKDLSDDLGIGVGDKIRIVTAEGQSELFSVAGVFDLGNRDANLRTVYTTLRAGQTLFDVAGSISALDVKVRDPFTAEQIAAGIESRTGLVAESWMKTNPQLLVALQSQNSSTRIMQFFITLTVALSIASVLIVSVVQKSREIGIMRAVGTSAARVQRIFLIQGGLVGFLGSILGSAAGAGLALIFVNLQKNRDGSPMFPILLGPWLFVIPIVLATLVGLAAAVAPARRASRLDPAEVIRYG
jgi:lipoprotein-releasing system permease protein